MFTDKILKEFGDIASLAKFVREAINDGEQISKGKSDTESSKVEKEAEAPEAGAEGGEAAAAEEPIVDPVMLPGSQIQMGGIDPKAKEKKQEKERDNPNAIKMKFSGKKEKIDFNPMVDDTQKFRMKR